MKKISDETKAAILEAAWRLIAERGRVDVSQSDIAAAAGVSRQTVFYAFGNRSGLLTAMARRKDSTSPLMARLLEVSTERRDDPNLLLEVISAWIDYIPDIYPVASLLDAAALTDPEANTAISDRMVGQMLNGFTARMRRMAKRGQLADGVDPDRAAQAIWAAIHLRAWRSLVIECGWSADEFKASRVDYARGYLKREG